MTENPWKTKSKLTVYENPWIRVEHHEVITPAGKDGIYGKTHFKNKAIAILPIDQEGNTWMQDTGNAIEDQQMQNLQAISSAKSVFIKVIFQSSNLR